MWEGDSGTLGIFIVLCMYDTLWPSRDTKLTYINNHDTYNSVTDVFFRPVYPGDHERGQKPKKSFCWFIADIL